jgi:hypothetical protein
MATMRDFIARTLRKLPIQGIAESGDPDLTAHALDAFNMMASAWKLQGVNIYHADVVLTDDFPLPQEFEEGSMYLLAERLRPDFQRPRTFNADDWFRTFQAAYMPPNKASIAPGLLNMPSQRYLK